MRRDRFGGRGEVTRRFLLGALAIVFLGAAVVATGAVVLDGDDTDSLDEIDDLVAYPDPGPNGAYAYLDEDGELTIDLTEDNPNLDGDGVPAEAFTGIDDVFHLEYTGEKHATVWLESDEDRIEFYTDDGSIEGKDQAVTLGSDESVAVGFSVDSKGYDDDELTDTLWIHAEVEAEDENDDVISPPNGDICLPKTADVKELDKVTRAVSITNPHTCDPITADLSSLQVGSHATLESMELSFASSEDVDFEVRAPKGTEKDDAFLPVEKLLAAESVAPIGSYEVVDPPATDVVSSTTHELAVDRAWLDREGIDIDEVGLFGYNGTAWNSIETTATTGEDTITFEATAEAEVLEEASVYALGIDAPVVSVTDVELRESTIHAGEEAGLTATISNDGPVDAAVGLDRLVDDEVASKYSKTVPAGESATVSLSHVLEGSGSYEFAVGFESQRDGGDEFVVDEGTVDAGSVDVSEPDAGSPGDGGDDEPGGEDNQSDGDGEDDPDSDDGLPLGVIGGITISIVALGGGAILYVRRL